MQTLLVFVHKFFNFFRINRRISRVSEPVGGTEILPLTQNSSLRKTSGV